MPVNPDTYISPQYTVAHWSELRPSLDDASNDAGWSQAISMLKDRIENRFFEPIKRLQDAADGADLGFGFAILTLDCLLIDTIQSFREGRTRGDEARTAKAFIDFLRKSDRLNQEFFNREVAYDFFDAIRCGLMHDGETRKGWRVWKTNPDRIVEKVEDGYILYRDNFHEAIRNEFDNLIRSLSEGNAFLRDNFLKRMDGICGLTPVGRKLRYFAYGSNMNQRWMADQKRAPNAKFEGVAELADFRVVFNKRSTKDGTAKANIVATAHESAKVQGALYCLSEDEFEQLKEIEKGYFPYSVKVNLNGASITAQAFIADATSVYTSSPSQEYLLIVLDGARDLKLDDDYIELLASSASNHQVCQ